MMESVSRFVKHECNCCISNSNHCDLKILNHVVFNYFSFVDIESFIKIDDVSLIQTFTEM